MKKFFLVLKILIALALICGIVFFAYKYVTLQKAFDQNAKDVYESDIARNELAEQRQITYEDADEEKLKLFEEYMPKIYIDFQGDEPLPEFTNIRDVDKNYITKVAYFAASNGFNAENVDEYNQNVYTYDELNSYIVSLFGKNSHNLFDRVTDVSDYFFKNSDGYMVMGMGGSEVFSYEYFIDSLKKGSDGKYYGYIYEYLIFSPGGPILDASGDGSKLYLTNTKQSSSDLANNKLVSDNIIKEYTYEVTGDESSVVARLKDENGYLEDDYMAQYLEVAKENTDKLLKKELVLTYDETLNCFYLESVRIVNN